MMGTGAAEKNNNLANNEDEYNPLDYGQVDAP